MAESSYPQWVQNQKMPGTEIRKITPARMECPLIAVSEGICMN